MTTPSAHDYGRHRSGRTAPGASPRRLRAASTPPPAREEHHCWTCGRGPVNPLERITMTAQWLITDRNRNRNRASGGVGGTGGGPTLRRFCPGCRPTGPISDLTCSRCGDGPLLVGDLAADPVGHLPDPAREWLTGAGWDLTRVTDPICPGCTTPPRPAAHPGTGGG